MPFWQNSLFLCDPLTKFVIFCTIFLSKLAIYQQRFHEIHIFCDFYWHLLLFLDLLSKFDFSRLFYEIHVFFATLCQNLNFFSHDFFTKLSIFCLCLMKFAIFCSIFYLNLQFSRGFFLRNSRFLQLFIEISLRFWIFCRNLPFSWLVEEIHVVFAIRR